MDAAKDTPIFEASDEDESSSSNDSDEEKKGGELSDQCVVLDKDGTENKGLSPDEIKKQKRKTRLEKAAALAAMALEEKEKIMIMEPKRDKILTFRDMSHLSYFGGGGIQNSLSKKQLTGSIITSTDIAKDIIEDLLNIVFGEEVLI
jgi:hypothetical protein